MVWRGDFVDMRVDGGGPSRQRAYRRDKRSKAYLPARVGDLATSLADYKPAKVSIESCPRGCRSRGGLGGLGGRMLVRTRDGEKEDGQAHR